MGLGVGTHCASSDESIFFCAKTMTESCFFFLWFLCAFGAAVAMLCVYNPWCAA